ncbi:MAG: lipoate--protein ligase family protein [Planctomycetales bacterium]|nr:lipoate--protein ligase family protein [Planctomycetales bacterium]
MHLLERTLPKPEENLALDEALLDEAEASGPQAEVLRIWEPVDHFVVLGRTSRWRDEARADACRQDNLPVLRRTSGGAAVLAGPGCLMYAVVLHYAHFPELRMLDRAHRFVLSRLADALRPLATELRLAGTSDLAIGDLKFSGNSLRCKREAMLYHGTVMYSMPIELVAKYLGEPPRQPAYREGRPHEAFIGNFPADREAIVAAIRRAWEPLVEIDTWPQRRVKQLIESRYGDTSWHCER